METVINPKTGRFIIAGGKLHRKLVREGLLPNTILIKKKSPIINDRKSIPDRQEDILEQPGDTKK